MNTSPLIGLFGLFGFVFILLIALILESAIKGAHNQLKPRTLHRIKFALYQIKFKTEQFFSFLKSRT